MYKICSNIKCFSCQDIVAQSGETCSDCGSILIPITPYIQEELRTLQDYKDNLQVMFSKIVRDEIVKSQYKLDQELAKPVEQPILAEPSMKDQINNLDESVSFNKWRERKIK